MTPDEWKEGMQNEAASVNDARWSADTQLQAKKYFNKPTFQRWLVWMLAFTAFSLLWTVVVNFYLFSHSTLLIYSPSQPPIWQVLMPLPGVMLLFFLSYFLTRGQYPVWAILAFILTSGLLGKLVGSVVTVPFTPSDGLIMSDYDLLPSMPLTWKSLGVGLLWMVIPVTAGVITARFARRLT